MDPVDSAAAGDAPDATSGAPDDDAPARQSAPGAATPLTA
jgi:hypothetical protein